MKKVSIITRAYNKLEYTIRCIESVRRNTSYSNYEHIIINNGSNDGTTEWLKWINGLPYFDKVKSFNMDKNYGDWGGMLKSLELVADDSDYIVQLDNDIEIKDTDWVQKMILGLEQPGVNIIQLKRMGVYNNITPINIQELKYKNEILKYGISPAKRPVAFFMLKTKAFKEVKNQLPLDLMEGKTILSKLLGGTYKFSNVVCYLIDAFDYKLSMNFYELKYPRDLTYQKINQK